MVPTSGFVKVSWRSWNHFYQNKILTDTYQVIRQKIIIKCSLFNYGLSYLFRADARLMQP